MNLIKSSFLTLALCSVAGVHAADAAKIVIGSVSPMPGTIITQFNYTRLTLSEPADVASVEQVGEISYQVKGFGALGTVTPGYSIEAVKTRNGDINVQFTADAAAELQDAGKWPVSDPGEYIITIPDGALKVTSAGGTVYTNDLITLTYDLLAPVTYVSSPKEGEKVAEFDKVTLQFSEYQGMKLNNEFDVTLRNGNGVVLPTGEPSVNENFLTIPLSDGVCSESGIYTFDMAPGSVTLLGNEVKGEQINPAISFTFECVGNQAVEIKSISPKEGVVELLAGVNVIYTMRPMSNPDCRELLKVYCDEKLVFETANNTQRVQFAIDNADPNTVNYSFGGSTKDFLRAPGVYRIEIPEGFMMFGTEEFRLYSDALSLEYIIQEKPKYTVTPKSGNVESISEVTMTFTDIAEVIDNKIEPDEQGDGGIAFFGSAIDPVNPEVITNGNSVTFIFDNTYTTPGNYYLSIPFGALTLKKSNGEEIIFSGANISYTISRFPAPVASPAPGEYETLDAVTFTLAEGMTYNMWINSGLPLSRIGEDGELSRAGIWKRDNNEPYKGERSVTTYPEAEYDLIPGDYVLKLGASTFYVVVEEGYPYEAGFNSDFDYYYTIIPAAATEMTPEYEDGHEFIGQLSSFDIYFEKADELTLDESGALPIVTTAAGEAVSSAVEVAPLTNRTGLCVAFNPAIEAIGDYIVTIPAGMLRLDGHANPQYVLAYKVNGQSAVTGVVESVAATVYGIDGTVVMRNADSTAIGKLPRGLYIINGKKVVVR